MVYRAYTHNIVTLFTFRKSNTATLRLGCVGFRVQAVCVEGLGVGGFGG